MARLLAALNSILARVFLLTLGLLTLAIVSLISIMQTPVSSRVFDSVIETNASGIGELVWLIKASPRDAEQALVSSYNNRWRLARIENDFAATVASDTSKRAILIDEVQAANEQLVGRDIRFRTLGLFDLFEVLDANPATSYTAASSVQIAIELEDGRVLNIWLPPWEFYVQGDVLVFVVVAFIALFTLVLGLALYWVIMRPIRVLERDAELVGLAEASVPVTETGPRELRRLSAALNRMRSRLANLVREREQIGVAIAHDVRTGLTKLRLRMEDNEALQDERVERDIDQMERLLSDMLAYARAESPVVEHELIELRSFVSQLAESAPYEVAIEHDVSDHNFSIAGSRIALSRLFENLLENARRYGAGMVRVRFARHKDGLSIQIEDDGPGIAPRYMKHVFEPFFRGERSRNRTTGGTGLGLGIARAIAHTHGAELSLANRNGGGLVATVSFPAMLAM